MGSVPRTRPIFPLRGLPSDNRLLLRRYRGSSAKAWRMPERSILNLPAVTVAVGRGMRERGTLNDGAPGAWQPRREDEI